MGTQITGRPDHDQRFTMGLTLDVADVLKAHGYPELEGVEHVDLQQALYRFLYGQDGPGCKPVTDPDEGETVETTTDQPVDTEPATRPDTGRPDGPTLVREVEQLRAELAQAEASRDHHRARADEAERRVVELATPRRTSQQRQLLQDECARWLARWEAWDGSPAWVERDGALGAAAHLVEVLADELAGADQ